MNHSFLCLPGSTVYPVFGYRAYSGDHDFDRFVQLRAVRAYNALTFTASTS